MSISNKSGIIPVGPRVLLLPDQIDERSAAGIIKFSPAERVREELAQTEGTVVEVGATAYTEDPFTKDDLPWCQVGDRVIFAKFAGLICPGNDGLKYRLVHDRDIVAIKHKAQEASNG